MSEFSWSDETYPCSGCANAHYTDICRNTPFLWCNETRSYITEKTSSWLCHNEHYKSKFAVEKTEVKENKAKENADQIPGQLTLEGII